MTLLLSAGEVDEAAGVAIAIAVAVGTGVGVGSAGVCCAKANVRISKQAAATHVIGFMSRRLNDRRFNRFCSRPTR